MANGKKEFENIEFHGDSVDIKNDFTVRRDVTITNDLAVNGNIDLEGDLDVNGALSEKGVACKRIVIVVSDEEGVSYTKREDTTGVTTTITNPSTGVLRIANSLIGQNRNCALLASPAISTAGGSTLIYPTEFQFNTGFVDIKGFRFDTATGVKTAREGNWYNFGIEIRIY